MNRYRRLEETMKAEGLSDQEVNFQNFFNRNSSLFIF